MLRLAKRFFTQPRPRIRTTRSERLKAAQAMSKHFESLKMPNRVRNLKDFFLSQQQSMQPPSPPRLPSVVTYQHIYQVNEDFGWAEREEIPAEGRDYLETESVYADIALGTQTRLQEDLGKQFARRASEDTEEDEVQYGGRTYWFKPQGEEVHICTRAAGTEEVIFSLSELRDHPLLQTDDEAQEALQNGYFPIVNIVAAQEGGLLALVLDFSHYDYG